MGFQRAGEHVQIGRRLERQDTDKLVLLWAFHNGSDWEGMGHKTWGYWVSGIKVGKSRVEQNFCLGDQWEEHCISLLMACSNLPLWARRTELCWIPSWGPVSQESKLDWGGMWRAGPCTVSKELRIMQDTVCKESCTGFSLRSLSALKCYDSVINLLNKLIVQTVFQEEYLNYLWEQTF